MDFTNKLDGLQQHVADAKSAAQSAVTESRDKLEQRIDQAQVDLSLAGMDAKQHVDEKAARARGKWSQLKADASTPIDEVQARLNKRGAQIDSAVAASDADWAEADANDAIDFAAWAIDSDPLNDMTVSLRVTRACWWHFRPVERRKRPGVLRHHGFENRFLLSGERPPTTG